VSKLGTRHNGHLGGDPTTQANAHQVDCIEAGLLQEPVVEDGLVGYRADPGRAFGVPVSGVRWGVHRRLLGQALVECEPAFVAFDAVQHQARPPAAAFEQVQGGLADLHLLGGELGRERRGDAHTDRAYPRADAD